MDALFVPCSIDGLSPLSGSILFRARWLAKYWGAGKAEVYDGTQRTGGYQLYVFQKSYRSENVRRWVLDLAQKRDMMGEDRTLVLDMCDPDWLSPEVRERMLDVLPLFDMATCPTEPLAGWLGQYLPTYIVRDGIDPEAITHHHVFNPTDKPSIGWIGYKGNLNALAALAPDIQAVGLEVDVVQIERSVSFDVFLATLARYDILLNPRPAMEPFIYKSPNKSIVAWAAGVAVAEKPGDLPFLCDPDCRRIAVETRQRVAVTMQTAARSAEALYSAIQLETWARAQKGGVTVEAACDCYNVEPL